MQASRLSVWGTIARIGSWEAVERGIAGYSDLMGRNGKGGSLGSKRKGRLCWFVSFFFKHLPMALPVTSIKFSMFLSPQATT